MNERERNRIRNALIGRGWLGNVREPELRAIPCVAIAVLDGYPCGKPAVCYDQQRNGMVCADHKPKESL